MTYVAWLNIELREGLYRGRDGFRFDFWDGSKKVSATLHKSRLWFERASFDIHDKELNFKVMKYLITGAV